MIQIEPLYNARVVVFHVPNQSRDTMDEWAEQVIAYAHSLPPHQPLAVIHDLSAVAALTPVIRESVSKIVATTTALNFPVGYAGIIVKLDSPAGRLVLKPFIEDSLTIANTTARAFDTVEEALAWIMMQLEVDQHLPTGEPSHRR